MVIGLAACGVGLLILYGVEIVDAGLSATAIPPSTRVWDAGLDLVSGQRWTDAKLAATLTVRLGPAASMAPPPTGRWTRLDDRFWIALPGAGAPGHEVVGVVRAGALQLTRADGAPVGSLGLPAALLGVVPSGDTVHWDEPLTLISPALVTAVVDIEDRAFLAHSGLSFRGLVRAALRDLLSGGVREGGSTITQQLTKIVLLRPARTVARKVVEAWLASLVEYRYDKRTILEAYLNRVYLGQDGGWQIVGVGAACRFYFNADCGALDLGEAALLAGMIAAPNRFDPFAHPEAARVRRDAVIDAMLRQGHITATGAARLRAEALPARPARFRRPDAAQVVDEIARRSGFAPEVRSSVVSDVQSGVAVGVEEAIAWLERGSARLRRLADSGDPLQVAVLIVDRNGRVLALRGSRSGLSGEFNRALSARRQVGSLVKPFIVADALEHGRQPTDMLLDEPISVQVGASVWRPRNADDRYRGPVTIHEALVNSLNVPMVRLGLELGLESVATTLGHAGFDLQHPTPALLLGAFEATPAEVARAYAGFIAGGSVPGLSFSSTPAGAHGALCSSAVAERVVALLHDVVRRGTAGSLARDYAGSLAAKTGTTDDRRDSWFVAIRPQTVTVVWVGTDGNQETGLFGATGALEVWRRVDLNLPPALRR